MFNSFQQNFDPRQNYYNDYMLYYQQQLIKKEDEKRTLKKLGFYAGLAILGWLFAQIVLVLVLKISNLYDKYYSDPLFSSAVDIIVSVFGMLLSFGLCAVKMKKVSGAKRLLLLDAPEKKSNMALAVVAGVGICMFANIVSGYITAFFELFRVGLSSPDIPMGEGIGGFLITFFRVAVTAAVVEELSMRGFVMGNLRYYGDGFAIVVSSIVFALMHGNLIQSPFALIAGFGLGYLSVKTGSLWTGIIIHLINNGISVMAYYLIDLLGESRANIIYALILYGFIFAGAICFAVFSSRTKNSPLSKGQSCLTSGEKLTAFFTSPTMIMAVLYMLYVTVTYMFIKN
ncbi:MAG: lysostaphin resistance A-like protein [Acutalibacteraceae bacterium]